MGISMKSGSRRIFISLCLLFVAGAASAQGQKSNATCSLSLQANGGQCAGFSILDSQEKVLGQCLDLLTVRETYLGLMKAGTCEAFKCSIKALSQCANQGGYAVTNEKGEGISSCETARAAIDDLHFFTESGACDFQGW